MEEKLFYYKYSDYSSEQVMNDSYKQIAELIQKLATTEEVKEKINSILYEGGFEGFSVNLDSREYIPGHKDSPSHEAERRLQYAYFLAKNPEAFDAMIKNNTNLFHGTKIDALPSILKYGMNSLAESANRGIDVTTGEEWSRIPGKNRKFISFTDSIKVALGYASLSSKNKENRDSSFGVMIGIAPEALEELDAIAVDSDVVEIGIMDHIPLNNIKVLTVPKEKVDFVSKLVGELDIQVVGAEINDPFYQMNRMQKIEYLMSQERNQPSILKEYNKEDMQKVAKTAKLSRIMRLFENVKNKFSRKDRGNQYGEDGR